jgi:hypothetical protein
MHIDEEAILLMKTLRDMASTGLLLRNKAAIKVRQPLEAITFPTLGGLSEGHLRELCEELNVKNIYENSALGEAVLDTDITEDLREEGSVRELIRAIKDLRKEAGLQSGQKASVQIWTEYVDIQELVLKNKTHLQKECSLVDILFLDVHSNGGVEPSSLKKVEMHSSVCFLSVKS